ncbi:MAG: response regulator, partial [Elusimicrobia bacterium]|nr:response regulator [Elusimicrobiota bacterium]
MAENKMDVIIIDDDPIVGQLGLDVLKDAGLRAVWISESRQAIQNIREKLPKLVMLDIMMPGIDGMSLCKQIKTDPELKGTKVIMVSGKSMQAEQERAKRIGADLFLEKPYDVDALPKTIRGMIGLEDAAPEAPPAPEAAAENPPPGTVFTVQIWGSRGGDASGAAAAPAD